MPPASNAALALQRLLGAPHVLLLDVEPFWRRLFLSFDHPAEAGEAEGWPWCYAVVTRHDLGTWLPGLQSPVVACLALRCGADEVMVLNYVGVPFHGCYPYLSLRAALLAPSVGSVAKLRLVGDAMIAANGEARDAAPPRPSQGTKGTPWP